MTKSATTIYAVLVCGLLTLAWSLLVSSRAQPSASADLIADFHLYNLALPILAIRDCYLYDISETQVRPVMKSSYGALIERYGSQEAIRQATLSIMEQSNLMEYGSFDAACGAYQDWLRMVDTDTRAYLAGWLKIFETIEPVSD